MQQRAYYASRYHISSILIGILVILACTVCCSGFTDKAAYADTVEQTATLSITGTNDQTEARKILALVNEARAATTNVTTGATKSPGEPLAWDYELEKAARQRAAEISLYFDHTRPDGTKCSTASNLIQGENIHANTGLSTAQTANTSWINSPGHYANMIHDGFTTMAAASFKIDGVTYWVELFGGSNSGTTQTSAVNGSMTYSIEALPSLLDLSFATTLPSSAAKGSTVQYRVINTNLEWAYSRTTINVSSFNWTSSNPSVAIVDAAGKATVIGTGAVTISAKNKKLATVGVSNAVTLKAPGSATSHKEGWVKSGNRWWYRYSDGSYPTGLKKIGSATYFFDNSGWMKTGWQHATGNYDWYYFSASGAMATGWTNVSGKWYYMNHDGIMQTGKQVLNNKIYFLDASGAMMTGWVKDGKWYYCNPSGAAAKGWIKVSGTWYFMDSSGVMSIGWVNDGGKMYYLQPSGAMSTGWSSINGDWHYFGSSGAMAFGWQKVSGKWYYLNNNGVMLTGKRAIGNKTYFLETSGAMKVGWNLESGKYYYYDGSGAMRTNAWISGKYWVGADGVMATDAWVDGGHYYVDAQGAWVKDKKR